MAWSIGPEDIVFGENVTIGTLPLFVNVQFDSYSGPEMFQDADKRHWIPIAPIPLKNSNYLYERTQIPLRLFYAMTIYKAQG